MAKKKRPPMLASDWLTLGVCAALVASLLGMMVSSVAMDMSFGTPAHARMQSWNLTFAYVFVSAAFTLGNIVAMSLAFKR